MSETWDQDSEAFDVSGMGDPYEPGPMDVTVDLDGDLTDGGELDPYIEPVSVFSPVWEPGDVSCCDCATPGWEPELGAQVEQSWASDATSASVILSQGTYDPGWSSWDAVAADPTAGVVTVGQPLAQAFPEVTVMSAAGEAVDPSTVYPTSFTVGGQGLTGAFTVIPADPIASPPTTSMAVIGGTSLYGDITITDAAGNPVDPNASLSGMATIGGPSAGLGQITITDAAGNPVDPAALMPSVMTIGGPSAGLGNLGGASPLPGLHSLLGTLIEKGDAASAAMIQSIIASQNHMIDIWTAPSNTTWERQY